MGPMTSQYVGIGQYVRLMDLALLIWLNRWNSIGSHTDRETSL